MEKLTRNQIVEHMKRKKLFGLLSGKSTTLQLLLVLDQWTETLDNGGSIDSCLYGFHEGVRQSPP